MLNKIATGAANDIILDDLELSVRTYNILHNLDIKTLNELSCFPIDKIKSYRGCGVRTIDEIRDLLEEYNNAKYIRLWNVLRQIIRDSSEDVDIDGSLLTAKTYSIIKFLDIKSINELPNLSTDKIESTMICGNKTVAEIITLLDKYDKQHIKIQLDERNKRSNKIQFIPSYIAYMPISTMDISVRAKNALYALNISKLHEILDYSFEEILKTRNCGRKTVKEIISFLTAHNIEQGNPYEILELENSLAGSDLLREIRSFESRIKSLDIYEQRIKSNLSTLKQLADANNITRERIRQKESKILLDISLLIQKYADYFWGLIEKYGDFVSCDIQELTNLKEYVQLFDGIFIRLNWNISFDVDCRVMYRRDVFDDQIIENYPASGTYKDVFDIVSNAFEIYVKNETPEQKQNFSIVSEYLINKILNDNYERIDDQYYLNELFLENGTTKSSAEIALLFKKKFPNGAYIYQDNTVYEKISTDIPGLTRQSLRGRLTNNKAIILMKRGYYIHKDFLTYDASAIVFAFQKCKEILKTVHNFYIDALFNEDREYYFKSGIKEPYLLYSLLRIHASNALSFHKLQIKIKDNNDSDTTNVQNSKSLIWRQKLENGIKDIIDFEVGKSGLLDILKIHFQLLSGYSNINILWNSAQNLLPMFLNDNAINTPDDLWIIVSDIFRNEFIFYSPHIWQAEPNHSKNARGLVVNIARENRGIATRNQIDEYFNRIMLKTPSNTALISQDDILLLYDSGKYITREALNLNSERSAKITRALDNLFANENMQYIVLRDIKEEWFSVLPKLSSGLCWSPLLLQEVLRVHKDIGYRIVMQQIMNIDYDTLGSVIVPNKSYIMTFADVAHGYYQAKHELPLRLSADELRRELRNAGMFEGSELIKIHKALNDHRFAFTDENKMVMILEK